MMVVMIIFIFATMASAIFGANELLDKANAVLERFAPIYFSGFSKITKAIWFRDKEVVSDAPAWGIILTLIFGGGMWLFGASFFWGLLIIFFREHNIFPNLLH